MSSANSSGSHLKRPDDILVFPMNYISQHFQMAYQNVIKGLFVETFKAKLSAIGICMVLAMIANCTQIGFLKTFEKIKSDIKKINPVEKIKYIFSKKNLFEFLKSNFKILFFGILIYLVIKNVIHDLMILPFCCLRGTIQIICPIMRRFAYNVIFAYIVIPYIDFVFQKHDLRIKMNMSKDEIKREYKEFEGDPQIKGKHKQLHREMIEQDAPRRRKSTSPLIIKPGYIVVVLYYDMKKKGPSLPVILANGHGAITDEMIRVARENNIPIMRKVPLANALMDVEKF